MPGKWAYGHDAGITETIVSERYRGSSILVDSLVSKKLSGQHGRMACNVKDAEQQQQRHLAN